MAAWQLGTHSAAAVSLSSCVTEGGTLPLSVLLPHLCTGTFIYSASLKAAVRVNGCRQGQNGTGSVEIVPPWPQPFHPRPKGTHFFDVDVEHRMDVGRQVCDDDGA